MSVLSVADIIAALAPDQKAIPGLEIKQVELPAVLLLSFPALTGSVSIHAPSLETDSFLASLLFLLDKDLELDMIKESLRETRLMMSSDIDTEQLFKKFNYQKDRKMKKSVIQKALLTGEMSNDPYLHKFIVDYFSINIIVFQDGVLKPLLILSTDDTLESTPYKPTYLMFKDAIAYRPLVNSSSIVGGTDFPHNPHSIVKGIKPLLYPDAVILKDVFNMLESGGNRFKLHKNMSLSQLQEIAIENGVDIKRQSEKTDNMVRKSKKELWDDLVAISS